MSFSAIGSAVAKQARKAVIKAALDLEALAKTEIQTGAKSGKTYRIPINTTDGEDGSASVSMIEHQASAPGEAPANLFGVLAGSIQTEPSDDPTEAEAAVRVYAEYGAALELGREDGSIEPRPFIRPAADRIEKGFAQRVGKAVQAGVREGAEQ